MRWGVALIFVFMFANVSASTIPSEPSCTSDAECIDWELGNECVDGYCQFSCQTDFDCQELGVGNACMDGVCGYVQEASCDEDEDCLPGESCIDGYCEYTGEYRCDTDEDCISIGEGNTCMNGVCGYVEPAECTTDVDCPSGEICDEGYCVVAGVAPPGDQCEVDQDCLDAGMGSRCLDGYCEYLCTADEECQEWNAGNECIGGICAWTQPQMDPLSQLFLGFWNFVGGMFDFLFGWMG